MINSIVKGFRDRTTGMSTGMGNGCRLVGSDSMGGLGRDNDTQGGLSKGIGSQGGIWWANT